MDIKRAIEILNPEHREHSDSIEPVNEACRMGMQALEKQMPVNCPVIELIQEDTPIKVVYCRDCKYYQDNNGGYPHEDCKWRENETPDPTDYCSASERIDE